MLDVKNIVDFPSEHYRTHIPVNIDHELKEILVLMLIVNKEQRPTVRVLMESPAYQRYIKPSLWQKRSQNQPLNPNLQGYVNGGYPGNGISGYGGGQDYQGLQHVRPEP